MDDLQAAWLVQDLEAASRRSPRLFRMKVIAITAAAYAVLFLMLLLGALVFWLGHTQFQRHGLSRGVVGIGILALMLAPVYYTTLRALLARMPAPEGRAITRAEAPVLFSLLDKMRTKLGGPPVHHVLVVDDYNAAICQRPRWGFAGPSVNYLLLGLPFLFGQGTAEMMAVIAHEYGHLCGSHGRVSGWIYRQRRTLGAVYARIAGMEEATLWHAAMARALRAFEPYFDAYTFVLSRQDEYEADRAAVAMTGAPAAASGLIRSALLGGWYHEKFWPALYDQAGTRERPAFLPYRTMGAAFRINYAEWASAARLRAEWDADSELHDTHPCLRERVEAIGEQARLPQPLERHAAQTLLGRLADQLADEFDQAWWKKHAKRWGEHYRHTTRSQARLRELGAAPLAALALQDLQELALLKAELDAPEAAKPVLEHLLRQPGGPFPRAAYTYGCILLREGRRSGLDHLATAARHDRRLAEDAVQAAAAYLVPREGEECMRLWCESVFAPMAP